MARLRTLGVIHTTSNASNDDTEGQFDLVIYGTPNFEAEIGRYPFPDLANPIRTKSNDACRPAVALRQPVKDDAWRWRASTYHRRLMVTPARKQIIDLTAHRGVHQ